MMQFNARAVLAVVMTGVMLSVVSGCGMSESRKVEVVASQEVQLGEFADQADAWGADIIAQFPADETDSVSSNAGGGRQAGDNYEEWPRYYVWDKIVTLHADGARTPIEFADDLEPWLEEQGWVQTREDVLPRRETIERGYSRGGYSLTLEAYTATPPQAQLVALMIVTPRTNPDPQ
ncbi:hypothetical protein [Cryobacterium luteum]|uniref:Lipoprotein n=1 Tax=Cryobacterium luteum TaxID=1424661 RepID=A0A1H8L7R7_9MICO|nr:hypothetical protein [Cryobacterium luteum]TFB94435.1 hypothetical protein E3O10_01275 [Cryobacterium luteum]SEO01151.1 hypothetical protein SAMN05216281_1252 [Cryobacterium luteum]